MDEKEINYYRKQIIKTENINKVYKNGGQRIYEITHNENLTPEEIESLTPEEIERHYKNIEEYYKEENKKPDSLKEKKYEEDWKVWPSHKELSVSNFGRIKLNKAIEGKYKEGAVLAQKDEGYLKGKLYIEDYETIENAFGFKFGLVQYVYQIVAETFLSGNEMRGKDVHHISNDGYDNRPQNLMFVSREDHNKIHKKST